MSIDPLADRYLDRFGSELKGLPDYDRRELVMEIRSHVADAIAGGSSTADVLERLGPADRLAKAYRAEMALQRTGANWLVRILAATALVITTSIPSMVIIPLLAGLGIGFVAGGFAAVCVAIFPFAYTPFYEAPESIDRLLGALTGAGLAVAGVLALWGLYWYVKLLVVAFRKALTA